MDMYLWQTLNMWYSKLSKDSTQSTSAPKSAKSESYLRVCKLTTLRWCLTLSSTLIHMVVSKLEALEVRQKFLLDVPLLSRRMMQAIIRVVAAQAVTLAVMNKLQHLSLHKNPNLSLVKRWITIVWRAWWADSIAMSASVMLTWETSSERQKQKQ